jgi:hypothetical protein
MACERNSNRFTGGSSLTTSAVSRGLAVPACLRSGTPLLDGGALVRRYDAALPGVWLMSTLSTLGPFHCITAAWLTKDLFGPREP